MSIQSIFLIRRIEFRGVVMVTLVEGWQTESLHMHVTRMQIVV